jgi:hypothetical protein
MEQIVKDQSHLKARLAFDCESWDKKDAQART